MARARHHRQPQKWCLLVPAVIILLLVYGILYRLIASSSQRQHHFGTDAHIPPGDFLDDEEKPMACTLPSLDPWSSVIKEALENTTRPFSKCPKENLVYALDFQSSTLFRLTNTTFYWTNCCYKAVFRLSENQERFSDCFPIKNDSLVVPQEHEFLAIFCDSVGQTNKMIQVLALAPLKPEAEASPRRGELNVSSDETVNLVLHVWDSVSHMELQRAAPKLVDFLLKNLSAFTFNGYTKFGVNTLENARALLAGDPMCGRGRSLKGCHLIHKEFAQKGYLTSEALDLTGHPLFLYEEAGKAPMNYTFRPLARVADAIIANDYRALNTCPFCWGPVLALQSLLDYMRALATTMMGAKKRYYQMTWSVALTHDLPLYGSLGEAPLVDFLSWMQREGYLNSTAFVFMSDHGFGRESLRDTVQGGVESRMPFLYFLLPEWFGRKYPLAMRNLRVNRERLSSHLDTHATFLDLSDLSRIADEVIMQRTKDLATKHPLPKDISLFLPIPKTRTCSLAGIEPPFCICTSRTPLPLDSSEARNGSEFVVSELNKFLANHAKCAQLSLSSVRSASRLFATEDDDVIEVGFRTAPSDATFEAVVSRRNRTSPWTLSGPISRTNLYRNQSACVMEEDQELRQTCFCLRKKSILNYSGVF